MSRWTVANFDVQCGSADGRHVITAGRPVYLGPGIIRRCEDHAPCAIDQAQVDAARHALEASASALEQRAAREPSKPTYHRPTRPLLPFASVQELLDGFDPRAAQAGDSE